MAMSPKRNATKTLSWDVCKYLTLDLAKFMFQSDNIYLSIAFDGGATLKSDGSKSDLYSLWWVVWKRSPLERASQLIQPSSEILNCINKSDHFQCEKSPDVSWHDSVCTWLSWYLTTRNQEVMLSMGSKMIY